MLFESGLRFTQVCPCMRFTQVCPCVNKRVSRLRGVNVSCIHLSCQENCWRMVNSMGKLMFVSDNRNQLYKVRQLWEMFPFRRREKQDDCFFLNKRNLLERELSTQYSERKRFVPNQSLETWFVRVFQSDVTSLYWSNVLQSFTKIIFRSILFEFAFYSIHIFKSRLEGVSFYGNLLLFVDKSYRFDWICEFRHSLSWVGRQSSKPLCSQLC